MLNADVTNDELKSIANAADPPISIDDFEINLYSGVSPAPVVVPVKVTFFGIVILPLPSRLMVSLSSPVPLILSTFKILAFILYLNYLVVLTFDHYQSKEDQQP